VWSFDPAGHAERPSDMENVVVALIGSRRQAVVDLWLGPMSRASLQRAAQEGFVSVQHQAGRTERLITRHANVTFVSRRHAQLRSASSVAPPSQLCLAPSAAAAAAATAAVLMTTTMRR